MNLKNKNLTELAAAVILLFGVTAALWLAAKYLLGALLPFVIAWGVAFAVRPIALLLGRFTRMPQKLLRTLLVIVFILAAAFLLYLGVARLWRELVGLVDYVNRNPDIFEELFSITDGDGILIFEHREGFGAEVIDRLNDAVGIFISETVGGLLEAAGDTVTEVIRRLPGALLFVAVTVIASVYFALDLSRINRALLSLLPRTAREYVLRLKREAFGTALDYLRAYLSVTFLVFSMLLVGFLILRVEYSFILALVFALLDLLPVLGVGLFLLPWSLGCFFFGNWQMGVGLLLLFLVVVTVRQIAEPKILGSRLGLHPLLILGSMYVGLGLFGGVGVILGPLVALAVKSCLDARDGDEKALPDGSPSGRVKSGERSGARRG